VLGLEEQMLRLVPGEPPFFEGLGLSRQLVETRLEVQKLYLDVAMARDLARQPVRAKAEPMLNFWWDLRLNSISFASLVYPLAIWPESSSFEASTTS
jgi:hypothetical protein